MLEPAPPNRTRHRRGSRSLAALVGVAALAATFLLPGSAQAAGNSPVGSLDSVILDQDGTIAGKGWAADADAASTALRITLTDNGALKTSLIANASRPDVGAAHPEFGPLHGFSFRLADGDGAHQICAVAQNIGSGANTALGCVTVTVRNNPTGTMGTASLSGNTVTISGTATDANSTTPVTVRGYLDGKYAGATTAAGTNHGYTIGLPVGEGSHSVCLYVIDVGPGSNLGLGCQSVLVRNNPFGAVESAGQQPTGVSVSGYAIDLNSTDPVSVWVFVDGKYFSRVTASAPRPDLATRYPTAGPDHGYSTLLNLAAGPHTLCLWAINIGPGSNVLLGCKQLTVQNNPIGSLESVRQLPTGVQASGWAIDLNSTGSVTVNVSVDGKHVSSGTAALARSDLAAHYPGVGGNHGYSLPVSVPAGRHTVCVDAVNLGPGSNSRLGCANVTVLNNPIGALERADQVPGGVKLGGWALDLNTAGPVSVFLYLDGKYVNRVTASTARTDLSAHFPTVGGNHGYSVIVPAGPGRHSVCAYAINSGPGANALLRCMSVTLRDLPLGNLESAQQAPGGVQLTGWAMDAFLTSPVTVRVYVDGRFAASGTAASSRPGLLASYPNMGAAHGFSIRTPLPVGRHTVCGYVINPRHATNLALRCVLMTRNANPTGASSGIARVGISNTIAVSGWALDSDTTGAIQVRITSDGVVKQTVTANAAWPSVGQAWPVYGANHGYAANVTLDAGEHTVCAIASNVGPGVSSTLGCARITTSGEAAPAVPGAVTAWAGSREVSLSWTAPRSDNAAITRYEITVIQRGTVITVPGSATGAVVGSLTNNAHYTFAVRAVNSLGRGSAATVGATPTNIPPQITPAPVSTSHYLRNLTGNLATDAALMRSMGASDASHNPSGHNYLVLLQIGGQDEADQGALLSATARYVSYPAVVSAMKAYLDGYATTQRSYAPLTLAIGTNNDVDVSSSAGISWARNVVNPVVSYAASHHPGMIIAGANDMEPGFSATVSQTRAWLVGYLSATSAKFVFNGSADGCSTVAAGGRCNNGWSMSDLQYLSGGAAPTRTISLPQIYNYAMPLQWKYISLTGTAAGRARIYFGGPLTERTACDQAGSCGSITNTDAWSKLWSAISSSTATRQSQMPHGTDLRIN